MLLCSDFLSSFAFAQPQNAYTDTTFSDTHPILKCHRDNINGKDTAMIVSHCNSRDVCNIAWISNVWYNRRWCTKNLLTQIDASVCLSYAHALKMPKRVADRLYLEAKRIVHTALSIWTSHRPNAHILTQTHTHSLLHTCTERQRSMNPVSVASNRTFIAFPLASRVVSKPNFVLFLLCALFTPPMHTHHRTCLTTETVHRMYGIVHWFETRQARASVHSQTESM